MGPLVIIGNPNTIFIRRMAGYWHDRGIPVAIATSNNWSGGPVNEDGVRVISAESVITPQTQTMLDMLIPVMGDLERELHAATQDRVSAALNTWGHDAQPPSLLPALVDGVAIA